MGRRIPQSGKAKKEKLQIKRANTTAHAVRTLHPEEEAERLAAAATSRADAGRMQMTTRPGGGSTRGGDNVERSSGSRREAAAARSAGNGDSDERVSRKDVQLRLESRFLKLPLDLLNHHRLISATERLVRPIPPQYGYCLSQDLQPAELEGLTCPKRPKWRYTQTKLEVEKNEEGLFTKWIQSTDTTLATFASSLPSTPAPSFFERNLQVWRQLWRVSEASQILLVLVDVRFPLIHYPPSLEEYVKTLRPKKEVIIVLTKTDLVPKWLAEAWRDWFVEREGPEGASVVIMESYKETEKTSATQGTQPRFTPAAPTSSRSALVVALRKAHARLLQPPAAVADHPERLARWSPNLRVNVDFDSVDTVDTPPSTSLEDHHHTPHVGRSTAPPIVAKEKKTRRSKTKDVYIPREKKPIPGQEVVIEEVEPVIEVEEEEEVELVVEELKGDDAHPYLTIGLIGQPNVGKSSMLNALLGRKVVRASKTPGKTKSLQTIFWNSTVRLCDCPGLVCPSFAGMERQVLSGILPIQNVEPVLYFISQRMPLEEITKLKFDAEDYSTLPPGYEPFWTADLLLSHYALSQGFITAKAGRPDLYRAGAFIMRQLHSSAIPWAFTPPLDSRRVPVPREGIYLRGFNPRSASAAKENLLRMMRDENGEESGSEEDRTGDEGEEGEESGSGSEDEDGSAEGNAVVAVRSAFAALMNPETDSEQEDDSDDAGEII